VIKRSWPSASPDFENAFTAMGLFRQSQQAIAIRQSSANLQASNRSGQVTFEFVKRVSSPSAMHEP
jgi:hypothetical protein